MSINDSPSASLNEQELAQQVAELEERIRRIGQPANSFEWRRRAFFETLARIRRQQLDALRHAEEAGPDRREFPRIALDLPAKITVAGRQTTAARMVNLSRGGAGLMLTREASLAAFPEAEIAPGQTVSLIFDLLLAAANRVRIQAECRVVWSRRVATEDRLMGLEFSRFEDPGSDQVEQYILSCLSYG